MILSDRELCDLELLLCGAFNPLFGFMTEVDYKSVLDNMTLSSGEIFPLPIVLRTKNKPTTNVIELRDKYYYHVANLNIIDVYKPDLEYECKKAYGTTDTNHPFVKDIMEYGECYYLGGNIEQVNKITHFDFQTLRLTPNQTKAEFKKRNWKSIVGFQTRNPMHRSHYELTKLALKEVDGILIHPVVGISQECDIDYYTRVKCYQSIIPHYNNNALLSLLPLSMRMAGPREAVLHAIIRKNYGCTHFIIGRDHAGPSYKSKSGVKFYGDYEAQKLLLSVSDKIGINILTFPFIVYVNELNKYMKLTEVPKNLTICNLSGTELRKLLTTNKQIPNWYSFPSVIEILKKKYKKYGLCIYCYGLSGSGKSTLIHALNEKLLELGKITTILDGDVVRNNLSKKLGFSKEDRSLNVRRIGYVSSEIVKHGGICLVANIAPYIKDRIYNRNLISKNGNYIEIFLNTSLEICEQRDIKGLYKLAREGKIKEFTGISDIFDISTNSELILDGNNNITNNINTIMNYIKYLL